MRQLFLNHIAQTSSFPLMLEVDRGEGIYLYDKSGKAYIDLISGIGVSCLGHCHPAVVAAVQQQAETYMHTMVYGEYILSPQVQLATLLTQQLPPQLDSVYFVNSGSEAVEGAMKLAKRYTGRYEIMACKNAYHGSTQGAASLMSESFFTKAYRPLLPNIRFIEFNNIDSLENITTDTAAVIVETIQGESGTQPATPKFLNALRKRCNKTGTLLILDEVQCGYGKTGTLFAFEQYGIIPDILVLAKGMGGGMPIGAFVANKGVMNTLSFEPLLGHITTFGGNPVCCAAALATLKTLLSTNLIYTIKQKNKLFLENLQHPAVLEIRGTGLMLGIQLASAEIVQKVISYCLQDGLITDWFLFNDSAIRIAPPLIISEEEILKVCGILNRAFEMCDM